MIRWMVRLTGLCCLWLLTALLLTGCVQDAGRPAKAPGPAPSPPPVREKTEPEPAPADLVHRIRWPGESLSIIARWYTGETANWRPLAEHNGMADPDCVRIGDSVRIPRSLLTTREPMPRTFVERHRQRPRKERPSAPTPSEEAPELFGPKEFRKNQRR